MFAVLCLSMLGAAHSVSLDESLSRMLAWAIVAGTYLVWFWYQSRKDDAVSQTKMLKWLLSMRDQASFVLMAKGLDLLEQARRDYLAANEELVHSRWRRARQFAERGLATLHEMDDTDACWVMRVNAKRNRSTERTS